MTQHTSIAAALKAATDAEIARLQAALAAATQWQPVGEDYPSQSCQCAPGCGTTWSIARGMLGVTASDGQWIAVKFGDNYAVCRRVVVL